MNAGFYSRLAIDGIRKNKRLYIPYIFTGMVMVMMSYIVFFLKSTQMLEHMKGGGMLRTMLPLGSVVITVFSLMFMFYSNSFVIRQRNREFGLYNVLGMDKRNLSALMFWENVIVSGISIAGGLVLGIVLSKLAELGMVNILEGEITYTMRIDVMSAVKTVVIFAVIYILLLFNSMIRVRRSNPVEMLKSSNVGEKAPKANWLLAIVGVVILAGAYYIALSIKQPLSAISWFMIAVVMVIVATYLIFISGSVAICRILQRNKNYYYKANHFVSVSSMVYRMKRNGAGLASICILCTMVLVMLSSTVSLYIGAEESIAVRYPKDIAVSLSIPELKHFNEEAFTKMRNSLNSYIPEKENVLEYSVIDVAGLFNNEGIIVDHKSHIGFDVSDYDNVGYVHIISLEDYNRMEGANEILNDGECLLYCYRTEYTADTFKIEGCEPLKVKKVLEEMHATGHDAMLILPMITIVTNNVKGLVEPIADVTNSMGGSILELFWNYSFDMDADAQTEIEVADNIHSHIDDILIKDETGGYSYSVDCREEDREAFFGMYGGLFFIGILLSIVFVFATVLIIYYKQISEGFEDRKRFEVMKKVGMTDTEIRKSINSQVLTVFILPILLAGLHLAVAFPIVWKLLQLFNLTNMNLMIVVTVASFVAFALIYAGVYKITSNAYYGIVSRREE